MSLGGKWVVFTHLVGGRFNNPSRQCSGSSHLNYTDAYADSLPKIINASTDEPVFTHEQVIDICPVLTTVEILYWSNILLNCWCVPVVVCAVLRGRCVVGLGLSPPNKF